MKKYICAFLAAIIMCIVPVSARAEEVHENMSLDEIYAYEYISAVKSSAETVSDDNSAYAYILHHRNLVDFVENQIIVDGSGLSQSENSILQDFVSRLNVLLEKNAIQLDSDFRISVKEAPRAENKSVRTPVIDLMEFARENAAELKAVYDNATFDTNTLVAGHYFAERVKTGGVWDLKASLGKDTTYYEPTLKAHMTGETIGNFHYGYVGSAVFAPFYLKSAAGFYQIISGTSDLSYWSSYFDDPADTEDIQWGIDVYNREH